MTTMSQMNIFLGRKSTLKTVIFIKSSFFRGLSWPNERQQRSEIFMVHRTVSALSTVKISAPYHVPISRYELPKVTKKLSIFTYSSIHNFLTAEYFEEKISRQVELINIHIHKKIQVIGFSHSRGMRSGKLVRKNEDFVVASEKPSQKPNRSIYFETACAKILSIPPFTTYIKFNSIGRSRLSRVGRGLYGMAHR